MKTAKRTLAVLLACLMVFGSFGVAASAKFNTSDTIAPVGGTAYTSAHGTITFGLDVYKDGVKVADGSKLSPGDVVDVHLSFGTDFYLGLISSQIYYDSTYFEPYLDGAVYTDAPANTFTEPSSFIKILDENAPTAQTANGKTATLFDTITSIEKNGYQGLVNKAGNTTAEQNYTPLEWRVPNAQGKKTSKCEIADEYKSLHYVALSLTCNAENETKGWDIKVPYAPYFSFQLKVKDGVSTPDGETAAIFVPIDGAKRKTADTCHRLYATECNGNADTDEGKYATKNLPTFGQGFDLTAADLGFEIGEAACEHEYEGPTWTWADDYSTASAKFVCSKCQDEQNIDATITENVVSAATCTADKVVTYTAKATFDGTEYSDTTAEVTVADSASGHNYEGPTWTWAADYSTASAKFVCSKCQDEQIVEADIDTNVVTPKACGVDQVEVYTASVTFNGTDYEDTTDEITLADTALDHDLGDWEEIVDDDENHGKYCERCQELIETQAHTYKSIVKIDATEDEEGSETFECEVCGHQKTVVIPKLAHTHTYEGPTWTWAADYSTASAKFVCSKCQDEQNIDATVTENIVTALSCTSDEVVTYTASVTFNGTEYSDTTDEITREKTTGHAYGDPTWIWAEDYSTASAKFVCSKCQDEQIIEATVDENVITDLTCTTDKVSTFTANIEFGGTEYNNTTDEIIREKTTGHNYEDPTWTWADDYSTASAKFVCSKCQDEQNVDATITENVVTPLSCTDDKVVTYTAKATFGDVEYEDTTDEVTAEQASGHVWGDWYPVDNEYHQRDCTLCTAKDEMAAHEWIKNADESTPATTTSEGENVYYCNQCRQRKTETVPKLDHEHAFTGEPVSWSWAEDYSSATATFKCDQCEETTTVTTTDISEEELEEATCTKDQVVQYVATLNYNGSEYEGISDQVTIADSATGHSYGEPVWIWAEDHSTASVQFTCVKKDDTQTIEATVTTNEIEKATCTDDQVVTYTAKATFDGTEYEDTTDEITLEGTATGHSYGEPEWIWAEDYSTASAKFVCSICKDEKTVEATVTSQDVSTLSCTTDHVAIFTAELEFNGGEYSDVTDEITVEATTGHNYEGPTWTWAADYSTASAKFVCSKCQDEQNVDATVTENVVTALSCTTDKVVTYTAKATFDGTEYEDTTDKITAEQSTGHNYEGPTWTWAEDYSAASAKFVCSKCQDEQNVDATVTTNEIKKATCTDDQIVTYTAKATFNGTEYSDTTAEVAVADTATGHAYDGPTWTWAADYSTASAKFVCPKCQDEQNINATITENVVSAATCTADKVVTYTAKATFNGTEYSDTTAEVTVAGTATGHSYGAPEWTWAADYSTASAKFVCPKCQDEQTINATIATNTVSALSCTTDNVVTYTASVVFNGTTYTDTTAQVTLATAAGHTFGDWTDNGAENHIRTCSACDATETAAHTFTEWTVVKEATEKEEGEETRSCTVCGRTETRPIEKLPASVLTLKATASDGATTDTANRISITVPYARKGATALKLEASEGVTYSIDAKGGKSMSVDANGNVTYSHLRLFSRTAVITATSADGKTATCEVKVNLKWWQVIIFFLFGYFWY